MSGDTLDGTPCISVTMFALIFNLEIKASFEIL